MNIIEIEDFISSQQATELIDLAANNLRKSVVLGENAATDYRIAQDTFVSNTQSCVVACIQHKLCGVVQLPVSHMEHMNIVKYAAGGLYKTHHDFFHPNTDYYDACMQTGGQRLKTALIYLNDDFQGGETEFPALHTKIVPKQGKLVAWDNVDAHGNLLHDSLHAGLPVTSGIKCIGVTWVRERPCNTT